MAKKCSNCKRTKVDSDFYFRSDKLHLLQSHCKKCILIKRAKYRLENIQRFKKKDKIYHFNNRDQRLAYLKKYQQKHKAERSKWDKNKRTTDIHYALRSRLHNRIRMALKNNSKHSTSTILLGCEISYFKKYFMSKFKDSMDWESFLSGKIHIDHIISCSLFDLSKTKDQKKCFHYTNLQPLWAKDNLRKSNKREVYYR